MNMKLTEKPVPTPRKRPLKRGSLLPNGATIIDFKNSAFDIRPEGIFGHGRLLAVSPTSPDPFVVWFFVEYPDCSLFTHGGHYYDQLEPALADLKAS